MPGNILKQRNVKEKAIVWHGNSLESLRDFPEKPRKTLGTGLNDLQRHRTPPDWKPFPGLARNAFELRTRSEDGTYRVIYVTFVKEEVHVLHAFKKTSQKTEKKDVEIANERLKALVASLPVRESKPTDIAQARTKRKK